MKKVAIQGYSGCFHEEAARRFYAGIGEDALQIVECDTFDGLYTAMASHKADSAVMAIENTVSGGLLPNFDLLRKNPQRIKGEVFLRIEQNLMALPGQKLEDIKVYFQMQKEFMDKYYNESTGYLEYNTSEYEEYKEMQDALDYYDAGTLVNNLTKGSSLIGEGLASCMYSFPRLDDEDRTRIIIMSTDNAEESLAKPLVELDEACDICKKNDIKVYGIFPNRDSWSGMNTTDYVSCQNELQKNVEKTGGEFYKQSESLSVDDIVSDIEKEEALEVEEVTITKIVDKPAVPIVILIISL